MSHARYKIGMKPRHAVALALVGWYLMLPPTRSVLLLHGPDTTAPLQKWKITGRFDSAAKCKSAKADRDEKAEQHLSEEHLIPPNTIKVVSLSVCVAADDPRLKPK